MPRHEFRTIEEFVHWLDKMSACWKAIADLDAVAGEGGRAAYATGKMDAFSQVATVARTSNLGIVYPPSGEK